MALFESLKACCRFVWIIAGLVFIVIAAEIAVMIGIMIIDELVSRWQNRKKKHKYLR